MLPAGSRGAHSSHPTYLQTAIVGWPAQTPGDAVATSIVLYSSADGISFTYLSTVASAADNPASDEGPNEHAMARGRIARLLCTQRYLVLTSSVVS